MLILAVSRASVTVEMGPPSGEILRHSEAQFLDSEFSNRVLVDAFGVTWDESDAMLG